MAKKEFDANRESQFGILPLLKDERPYTLLDNTWINIGLAIATWCFLIGGSVSLFAGFKIGVIGTLAGNMASVLVMAMASSTASAKYGVDLYSAANSYLGRNGTSLLMTCITVFQLVWNIILSIMFGRAIDNIVSGIRGIDTMGPVFVTAMSLVGLFLIVLIVWKGPLVMKRMNTVVAPMLLIVIIILLAMISKNYGWQGVLDGKPISPFESEWVNFLIVFELNLGAGLSWWPNMGGMGRLCKSEKASYWANLFGLVLAATAGTAVGIASAVTIGSSDPTEWMVPIGGVFLGVVALIFVAFANLTSGSVITYNMCLGLKRTRWFRNRSWAFLVIIYAVPAIIGLILWPSQIYDNFYILLGITCTFYCPIVAINTVDYFIFRKQNLDIRSLFNNSKDSKYNFWNGFNWVAIVVMLVGMPFYLLFLNPATLVYQEPFIYVTASGASVIFSGALYYALGKLILFKKGIGGYRN